MANTTASAVLRTLGKGGLWILAGALWLLVVFALVCMFAFVFVEPAEEEHMASIWLMIALVFATPALLLTAWLGGFWGRLFPEGNNPSGTRPYPVPWDATDDSDLAGAVVERAFRESLAQGRSAIGTEHLLIAALELLPAERAGALAALGLDAPRVRYACGQVFPASPSTEGSIGREHLLQFTPAAAEAVGAVSASPLPDVAALLRRLIEASNIAHPLAAGLLRPGVTLDDVLAALQ